MKRLLITFLFCYYVIFNLSAQNYLAEYYSSKEESAQLLFNSREWCYNVTGKINVEFSSNNSDLDDNLLSSISKIFTDFNYRSLDKNYYLDEELLLDFSLQNKCVIKGELIKPEWTIVSDSVKTIEGYTCLMAKGYVRGRDYTVWFTPDIPVSAGPWKLWGLPGLIVNARSDDGVVGEITLISLKLTDFVPEEPVVEKTIDPADYKVLFNEEANKFLRRIRSLSDDNSVSARLDLTIFPDKSLFE